MDIYQIFLFVSLIYLLSLLLKFLKVIYLYILKRPFNIQKRYGTNSWVVIVGSMDDITLGYVAYLLKQQFKIYLIAYVNSLDLPTQIQDMISGSNLQISVKKFNDINQKEVFNQIEEELKELDISLLIFNCSYGNENQQVLEFHENSFESIDEMISTNCLAPIMITRKLLNKMLERKNKSGILMLTSASGYRPLPFINIYSAIKHMQDLFAQALGLEYQNKIDICSVKTCWFKGGIYSTVAQNSNNKIPQDFYKYFVMSDIEFAEQSLGKLGILSEGEASLKHKIANYFIRLTSDKALYDGLNLQYQENKKKK